MQLGNYAVKVDWSVEDEVRGKGLAISRRYGSIVRKGFRKETGEKFWRATREAKTTGRVQKAKKKKEKTRRREAVRGEGFESKGEEDQTNWIAKRKEERQE